MPFDKEEEKAALFGNQWRPGKGRGGGASFIDGYILFSFLFFFLTSFSGGELKEMVSNSMGC